MVLSEQICKYFIQNKDFYIFIGHILAVQMYLQSKVFVFLMNGVWLD